MATKITISKALEKKLRAICHEGSTGPEALLYEIVILLDRAQEPKTASGLSPQAFLAIVQRHRKIVEPGNVPWAGAEYARLGRALNTLGATPEHAETLGTWLKSQTTWRNEITLDVLVKNLKSWLSKAVSGVGPTEPRSFKAPAPFVAVNFSKED